MHKIFLYFCTAFVLASCGKVAQVEESRSVLRMNLIAGLRSLDPAYAGDQSAWWMTAQLFNNLVEFDTALQLQPSLATHWEVMDSGRTYLFHLRRDVYFHPHAAFGLDSTRQVVAEDVRFSFERICDPEVAARGFWIFNGKVQGADSFHDGKSTRVDGFQAVDDSTFLIRLVRPYPAFLARLAMPYGSIVPKEVVKSEGKDFGSRPVGTGPFRFKSWKSGRSLVLLRNHRYWEKDASGRQLPYLDAVQIRFITERLTEFVELCQGRLDFVNGMDKTTRDEFFLLDGSVRPRYSEQFIVRMEPTLNTEFLAILVDTTLPVARNHPLGLKKVRAAINYAINRDELVQHVLNGQGTPAYAGIVPQGMPGFQPSRVHGFTFSPEKAAQNLKEAGYPGGKGLPPLILKSNPAYQAVMEYIQKSLERVGIQVKIDNMDSPTLREQAGKGELNLWRASWMADYPDAENYLGLFHSGNIPPQGANRTRFSNSEYDRLFELHASTLEDSLRFNLQVKMENILLEEAPVVLLYYDKMVRISSKWVQGLETNAMNMLILKRCQKTIL